jgi:hypothetical protein
MTGAAASLAAAALSQFIHEAVIRKRCEPVLEVGVVVVVAGLAAAAALSRGDVGFATGVAVAAAVDCGVCVVSTGNAAEAAAAEPPVADVMTGDAAKI